MTERWTENVPALTMTLLENGCVRLEDKNFSEDAIVDVHVVHLRLMAEKMGLAHEMCASEADALRTIATLKRRLLVLKTRIDFLAKYLAISSDSEHADLDFEITYATATADICEEFCADLGDMPRGSHVTAGHAEVTRDYRVSPAGQAVTEPLCNPSQTQPVTAPAQLELTP